MYEPYDRTARFQPTAALPTALRFATGIAPIGSFLVATEGREPDERVCAILLGDGDGDAALVAQLRERFPGAACEAAPEELGSLVAKVERLLRGPARGLDAALAPRGTAFERRVWSALGDIPAGTTASYGEVARRIGAPSSARAVARACAANPIAVAIPCHRVVRGDGDLSGYRWGIERKRALLALEGTSAARDGRNAALGGHGDELGATDPSASGGVETTDGGADVRYRGVA